MQVGMDQLLGTTAENVEDNCPIQIMEPILEILKLPKYKEFLKSTIELTENQGNLGAYAKKTEVLDMQRHTLRVRKQQLRLEQEQLDERKRKLSLEEETYNRKVQQFEKKYKKMVSKKSLGTNGFGVEELLSPSRRDHSVTETSTNETTFDSSLLEKVFTPFKLFKKVKVGGEKKYPSCFESFSALRKVRANYISAFMDSAKNQLYENQKNMCIYDASFYRDYIEKVRLWLAIEEEVINSKQKFQDCLKVLDDSQIKINESKNELRTIEERLTEKKRRMDEIKGQSVSELAEYLMLVNQFKFKKNKIKQDESEFVSGYLLLGYLHQEIDSKNKKNQPRKRLIERIMRNFLCYMSTAFVTLDHAQEPNFVNTRNQTSHENVEVSNQSNERETSNDGNSAAKKRKL